LKDSREGALSGLPEKETIEPFVEVVGMMTASAGGWEVD
jgi:hypothetical protein